MARVIVTFEDQEDESVKIVTDTDVAEMREQQVQLTNAQELVADMLEDFKKGEWFCSKLAEFAESE